MKIVIRRAFTKFRKECNRCGCIFSYGIEDLEENFCSFHDEVTCPCCGKKFYHDPKLDRKPRKPKNDEQPGEKEQSTWISVRERLPEESGEYLTWHRNKYYGFLEYNAELQGWNVTDVGDRTTEITSVTHWMPIPKGATEQEEPS